MSKFVIQVWDCEDLQSVEDGADADGIKAKLTVVAHSESEAEKIVATLDNFIQMSEDDQVHAYWVISSNELQETTPGYLQDVANLFMQAEKNEKSR